MSDEEPEIEEPSGDEDEDENEYEDEELDQYLDLDEDKPQLNNIQPGLPLELQIQ